MPFAGPAEPQLDLSSNATVDGRTMMYLRRYSGPYPTNPTSNTRSSIAQSSRSTATPPAQKGGLKIKPSASRVGSGHQGRWRSWMRWHLVRCVLLSGHGHESVGLKPSITDLDYESLMPTRRSATTPYAPGRMSRARRPSCHRRAISFYCVTNQDKSLPAPATLPRRSSPSAPRRSSVSFSLSSSAPFSKRNGPVPTSQAVTHSGETSDCFEPHCVGSPRGR
jgi:hypothetical protein